MKTASNPRKARVSDAKGIKSLVDYWSGEGLMLPKSISEIYDNLRDFWVLERDGKITGCAGLHIAWEDLAEVRSLAVDKSMMGCGDGSLLVDACIREAGDIGVKQVFALTYVKEFFERFGFKEVDKSLLPHKIWSECIKCPKFPDCDEIAVLYKFDTNPEKV